MPPLSASVLPTHLALQARLDLAVDAHRLSSDHSGGQRLLRRRAQRRKHGPLPCAERQRATGHQMRAPAVFWSSQVRQMGPAGKRGRRASHLAPPPGRWARRARRPPFPAPAMRRASLLATGQGLQVRERAARFGEGPAGAPGGSTVSRLAANESDGARGQLQLACDKRGTRFWRRRPGRHDGVQATSSTAAAGLTGVAGRYADGRRQPSAPRPCANASPTRVGSPRKAQSRQTPSAAQRARGVACLRPCPLCTGTPRVPCSCRLQHSCTPTQARPSPSARAPALAPTRWALSLCTHQRPDRQPGSRGQWAGALGASTD